MQNLPDELARVLASEDFADDGGVAVAGVHWSGDTSCTLLLDVHTGQEVEPRQAWAVTCHDIRDSSVAREWAHDLSLTDEHPLLLGYQYPHATLAFRGRAAQTQSAVGALWLAHASVTQGWIPFGRYLNPWVELGDLLASGSGVLADGPRPLLERYAAALSDQQVDTTVFKERPAKRYVDQEWRAERDDIAALVVGRTYLIGADFDVKRVQLDDDGAES